MSLASLESYDVWAAPSSPFIQYAAALKVAGSCDDAETTAEFLDELGIDLDDVASVRRGPRPTPQGVHAALRRPHPTIPVVAGRTVQDGHTVR